MTKKEFYLRNLIKEEVKKIIKEEGDKVGDLRKLDNAKVYNTGWKDGKYFIQFSNGLQVSFQDDNFSVARGESAEFWNI